MGRGIRPFKNNFPRVHTPLYYSRSSILPPPLPVGISFVIALIHRTCSMSLCFYPLSRSFPTSSVTGFREQTNKQFRFWQPFLFFINNVTLNCMQTLGKILNKQNVVLNVQIPFGIFLPCYSLIICQHSFLHFSSNFAFKLFIFN